MISVWYGSLTFAYHISFHINLVFLRIVAFILIVSHSIDWIFSFLFHFVVALQLVKMPTDFVLILAQFQCPWCKCCWKDTIIGFCYEQKCRNCRTIVQPFCWVSMAPFRCGLFRLKMKKRVLLKLDFNKQLFQVQIQRA